MTIGHAIIDFSKHIRGHLGSLTTSLPSDHRKDHGQGRHRAHCNPGNLDHTAQITLARIRVTAAERAQTRTTADTVDISTTVCIQCIVTACVGGTVHDWV